MIIRKYIIFDYVLTKNKSCAKIVAYETVSYATVAYETILGGTMPRISRPLNVISRCQASYRKMMLDGDFAPGYHVYALAICRHPGRSQDELAASLCINKSTIARGIEWLLEKGYVRREPKPEDKRSLLIYPTDKMLQIYPKVKAIADSWNEILTDDISEEELLLTYSVIAKMADNAKKAVFEIGGDKR